MLKEMVSRDKAKVKDKRWLGCGGTMANVKTQVLVSTNQIMRSHAMWQIIVDLRIEMSWSLELNLYVLKWFKSYAQEGLGQILKQNWLQPLWIYIVEKRHMKSCAN